MLFDWVGLEGISAGVWSSRGRQARCVGDCRWRCVGVGALVRLVALERIGKEGSLLSLAFSGIINRPFIIPECPSSHTHPTAKRNCRQGHDNFLMLPAICSAVWGNR